MRSRYGKVCPTIRSRLFLLLATFSVGFFVVSSAHAATYYVATNPSTSHTFVPTPGSTVDKNSGVLADPDWGPCTRDPNRNGLKHCSEEYRLCREAGNSSVACLAVDYPVLTPATRPSQDEYFSCRAAGHDEAKCVDILGAPIK